MKDILNTYSKSELIKMIQQNNVRGYSGLKKSQLIDLMTNQRNINKFSNIRKKGESPDSLQNEIIKSSQRTEDLLDQKNKREGEIQRKEFLKIKTKTPAEFRKLAGDLPSKYLKGYIGTDPKDIKKFLLKNLERVARNTPGITRRQLEVLYTDLTSREANEIMKLVPKKPAEKKPEPKKPAPKPAEKKPRKKKDFKEIFLKLASDVKNRNDLLNFNNEISKKSDKITRDEMDLIYKKVIKNLKNKIPDSEIIQLVRQFYPSETIKEKFPNLSFGKPNTSRDTLTSEFKDLSDAYKRYIREFGQGPRTDEYKKELEKLVKNKVKIPPYVLKNLISEKNNNPNSPVGKLVSKLKKK